MHRDRLVLLLLPLLFGCRDQSAPQPTDMSPNSVQLDPVVKPLSLSQAREGFRTALVHKTSAALPLPEPPDDLLQLVHYDSAIGQLGAYLTLDPRDGKRHPAIIWITGGDCSTLDEAIWQEPPLGNDQTARQFRESGIVTMYPTLRGGNQNPGFHEGFFGEVDDVLAAAAFLAEQDYVDPQRIYLGGHSSGATMVLLAAECSGRFRAVFSVCPTYDLRDYRPFNKLFQPFDTSNEREFELRAPGLWLDTIQVPTFIFAGTARDGSLPAVLAMEDAPASAHVHFHVVEGANHFDILAPTNRLIAEKIIDDDGPKCDIMFTQQELGEPFIEHESATTAE